MISTLELTKAASQKEGSHYGATKGSDATEGPPADATHSDLGDAIKAARAWCGAHCGCCGGDADAAEKEPLVAAADRSLSRGDDA